MSPPRVLIVEDDPLTVSLLKVLCQRHQLDAIVHTDGKSALDYIEHAPATDIVLLDLLLPLVSGYTILERIREKKNWTNCSVVILSAKDQTADQRHALALGANAYWVKPFDPDALIASLTQIAETSRAH
jgi:two-component system, OmpR family, alkaline phosphatase synthesis response regulator PhoP